MAIQPMILHGIESGEGAPLVLLHGLFGSARNLGTVQRALLARFRVIALDLRNHGASPHASGMSYPEMAADVMETLEHMDALPATLLGHSMGGKVAMHLALAQSAAVSRLIVADIAPVPYPPHFRDFAKAMSAMPDAVSRTRADTILAEVVADAAVRGFLLQNLLPGAASPWRIGLAEIAAGLPEIEGWDRPVGATYNGPTLFIAGERSAYIRPEHRTAIRALFPEARFVTLRGAGHWLHADNPKGFVSVVENFLAGSEG
jgi:pimeloyl-ACP methyl ester carboxylesterase